jgi:zinc protease
MTKITRAHGLALPGAHDVRREVLNNGITVLIRENFDSPSVAMNGYVNCGSISDPEEKLGLAFFTSLGLMRGTRSLPFQKLYDRLESSGASLGFSASVHTTSFGGRALSEDLHMLLELLSKCLREPIFPLFQIEKLRAQLLTGLMIRAQDTEEMASLAFDEIVFQGHPYSKPEDGFPETVKRITLKDIKTFHHQYYRPRGMVIVVVGGVKTEFTLNLIEKTLGGWKDDDAQETDPLPNPTTLTDTVRKHVELSEKKQIDLIMGTLGPCRKSDDYLPASLGNSILGQFGMMGRIGSSVREQAGLAYSASTSLNAWVTTGTWEVTAGVNPVNLNKAIDLIIKEIKRYTSEPVTDEELNDSKANFIGRMPIALESNGGVAGALLNIERFQLGLDYFVKYADLVKAVTTEQILQTAKKYLHADKLAIVSAGTEDKQA